MAAKIRMLARLDNPSPLTVPGGGGGRTYNPASGMIDVPEGDAGILEGNGWTRVAQVGTTAERRRYPSGPASPKGAMYFDVDLDTLIVWDGKNWRDPATGDAV